MANHDNEYSAKMKSRLSSVIKICSTNSNTASDWTRLPTAVELTPQWQTLDSENTGRDNNTGLMFRDKIADKAKWVINFPQGMNNTDVAIILGIVKSGSYWIKAPDSLTGTYATKNVYTSVCEPEILEVTELNNNDEPSVWTYKAFTMDVIEM